MQIFYNKKRGFTLIELLVVIAIIGILASIVLVSLGGARDRAKDARIQASMTQLRSTAELAQSDDSNYADVSCTVFAANCTCDADIPELDTLCEDVYDQGGTNFIVINDGDDAYCAEVQLNNSDWYCVDGNLTSKNLGATAPLCDGTVGAEVYVCE